VSGPARKSGDSKNLGFFSKSYKNPFFNALITYMEIVPVRLVVSALAAVTLKRKASSGKAALTN